MNTFSFSQILSYQMQQNIDYIKNFQEKIFTINDCLKEKYPRWAENNDVRRNWFSWNEKLVFMWQLNLNFVAKYLNNSAWWVENIESNEVTTKESDILEYIEEYLVCSRLNLVFSSLVLLEETLYSIIKKQWAVPKSKLAEKLGQLFGHNVPSVFTLHREMRNLSHLNWVFDPTRTQKEIEFRWINYKFTPWAICPTVPWKTVDNNELIINILIDEAELLYQRFLQEDISSIDWIVRVWK